MASNYNISSSPSKKQQDREKTPTSPAATSTVLSGPNAGERLASYFENFFTAIIGISTLGASLTFSKIIQAPVQPWIDYGVGADSVQLYMSISWLLFLLALVITSALASLLSLYRPQAVDAFGTKIHEWKTRVMWVATFTSLLLITLIFGSFIFLSLVVVAYSGPVGWITLGCSIFFGVLAIAGIIWQSPLEWPQWLLPKSKTDPTRINSLPSTRVPSLPAYPNYGPDPFLRHARLHGSLRHKKSFNDLQHTSENDDEGKDFENYIGRAEKGGSRTSGGYVDDGYGRDPPPPRKEFRHDRRERYSGGDHYTQYNRENRYSGTSTLVPGAYDENKRWSNTIPPVRNSGQRPYCSDGF
ncbi:MAG: hypothetical protein LQ340_004245 [Diploschistes diacapsis]|nr:MAG: hypothetical protein LQ340_004245 [Diploschistes diacapsis]